MRASGASSISATTDCTDARWGRRRWTRSKLPASSRTARFLFGDGGPFRISTAGDGMVTTVRMTRFLPSRRAGSRGTKRTAARKRLAASRLGMTLLARGQIALDARYQPACLHRADGSVDRRCAAGQLAPWRLHHRVGAPGSCQSKETAADSVYRVVSIVSCGSSHLWPHPRQGQGNL